MAKKVQKKTVSSSNQTGPRLEPFEAETMAAMRQGPLRQEVEGAVMVAASQAICKVMKDHGFELTPLEAKLMARFWVFDLNFVWDLLEAQNAAPAVMDN
jgi:hypothetical protein